MAARAIATSAAPAAIPWNCRTAGSPMIQTAPRATAPRPALASARREAATPTTLRRDCCAGGDKVGHDGRPLHQGWNEDEKTDESFGRRPQPGGQAPRNARDRKDQRDRDHTEGRRRGLQREQRRRGTYDHETE